MEIGLERVDANVLSEWDATSRAADTLHGLVLYFKPQMLLSPTVVAAAVHKARQNWDTGKPKTKCLRNEVYYAMGCDWEIQKVLSTFGPDGPGEYVRVKLGPSNDGADAANAATPWTPDEQRIKEYYKVSDKEVGLKGGLEAAVVMRIAIKGV